MKYAFRGLTVEECFLQPPEFHTECILEPENNADTTVLSKLLAGCTVYADSSDSLPAIKNVYFNDPVTVVLWDDGTKTIVRCQEGDTCSKEVGLAMCIAKKALGNKGNYNNIFKKWIPEEEKPVHHNIDEWDKTRDGLSDKLYRCVKEACALDEATAEDRFCRNCKNRYDAIADSDPCYSCDLSIHSNWKSDR